MNTEHRTRARTEEEKGSFYGLAEGGSTEIDGRTYRRAGNRLFYNRDSDGTSDNLYVTPGTRLNSRFAFVKGEPVEVKVLRDSGDSVLLEKSGQRVFRYDDLSEVSRDESDGLYHVTFSDGRIGLIGITPVQTRNKKMILKRTGEIPGCFVIKTPMGGMIKEFKAMTDGPVVYTAKTSDRRSVHSGGQYDANSFEYCGETQIGEKWLNPDEMQAYEKDYEARQAQIAKAKVDEEAKRLEEAKAKEEGLKRMQLVEQSRVQEMQKPSLEKTRKIGFFERLKLLV